VLTDNWDIAHINIVVPDLESAMEEYSRAFGVEWGPIATFSSEAFQLASPLLGEAASVDGLRAVWAHNGSAIVSQAPPFAPLELMHAESFSPAFTIWGCPGGRHYVHHVCYWVDDLGAESAHLVENGFEVELTIAGGSPTRGFAYHRSPTTGGMRIELMRMQDKPAMAKWLDTGNLELDW
jgi:catechol 2,3-dioxygenase-like lactoylglutathione lyase family enzyme